MRLILTTIASAALLMAAPGLVSSAFAHGGAYRGPAGEVPPDSREPSDPPPPPEGGGPTTPGGETGGPTTGGGDVGGPTTGGGDTGGPSTGGGGGAPSTGGGGGGGPKTGGAGRPSSSSKGPGYEDWTFWWNFNKDDILLLKSALKDTQAGTGTAIHTFGKKRTTGGEIKSPTDTKIQESIVPALRAMLDQKDLNFDIQSAAALALAKIGDESIIPTLKKMALNDGKDGGYNKVVEESAALAFGLLQKDTAEVREFLIDLVSDKDRNASFVRPFAAISLGLLGKESTGYAQTYDALMEIVVGKETKPDVKPAALLAIGLLEDDRAVPELMFMLENGKSSRKSADGKQAEELSDVELAFVVQALGKIGAPGTAENSKAVVDALTERLTGKLAKKVDVNVRRSSAIALGQIGANCSADMQEKVIKTLKDAAKDGEDASERNFAMISLGRIGGAEGVADGARKDVMQALHYYLDKGKPANLAQPFAALAMGLVGRASDSPSEEDIRKPLRMKFAEGGDPRARGAYAIASGLVRDGAAVSDLVAALKDRGAEKKLRGYSAVALGMIRDGKAKDAIRSALNDDSDRDLRVQTAVAAGLMGDSNVIEDLVKIVEGEKESQFILGSVALALGQIGDERAIDPLLKIAEDKDKKFPEITRALVTVALGQIGDRRDVPTLARVARDINFRAIGSVPSLTELLTIL